MDRNVPKHECAGNVCISKSPPQFGHVFKGICCPPKVPAEPSDSSLARCATLLVPMTLSGSSSEPPTFPCGQFHSAVSNPLAMAIKGHGPREAVHLPLPARNADRRGAARVFTPALQLAVLLCLPCSTRTMP